MAKTDNMKINGLGDLPYELKEYILLFLPSMLDRYNLAQAVTEFYVVYLRSNFFRTVDLSFENHLDDEVLMKIFNWLPNPSRITHLNLNGLYWIDPEIIKYVANKFTNLESLFIVDTKVVYLEMYVKYIARLPKLYTIAINTSPQLEYDPFSKSFAVVRNVNNRQPCIKFSNNKYVLEGNRMDIVMRPTSFQFRHKLGLVLNGTNWINEACNCCSFKEFSDQQRKCFTENALEILLDYRYKSVIRERLKLDKITEIILMSPQLNDLDLSPHMVTCFVNLQRLTLYNLDGPICLEEVFKECKMLRSLNINTNNKKFSLKSLQNAKSLEEISVNQQGNFDFYTTFSVMGPYENLKLKRIYIGCEEFIISSYGNFRKFLCEVPKLTFFHVDCDASLVSTGEIKKTMKDSKRHPSQYFGINKAPNWFDLSRIPLSHITMLWYECVENFN